jgi:uncharacterized protein (TIGR02246 family)
MVLPLLLVLMAALAQIPQERGGPRPMTFGDRAQAEAATRAYRDAWLTNNADRVMATLAPDAIIYPSGLPPISGGAAIRAFWFPAANTTRVVAMELTIDEVHLDGNMAVTSGSGSLTFVVTTKDGAQPARTQKSWHVNILKRQPDGSWRIWRRMWGDVRD